MARLIDADFLYDKVEARYRVSSGIEHRCERDFLDLICAAPTIDPESLRPHGHWIQTKSAWRQKQLECSCCGSKWPEYAKFFAYCPYCGAKMEEINHG